MKISALLIFFLLINGCSSPNPMALNAKNDVPSSRANANNSNITPSASWSDSVLQTMSLREKIAQLFVVWTRAGYIPEDSKQWQEKLRFAKEIGVGGFYFSHGNAYGFAVNANKLQSVSQIPLLISADFEWGTGMRIEEATTFPRAMALGASRDTNLAYEMGKVIARESRAIGVHHVYSPDVDINNNPKNPVINTRSFGEDPALVSAMARAYIRGTHEERVISTAKHFPGHGDTEIDTHLDLPSVHFTRARFDSLELVPFRDAVRNGVMSVMVAHIHAGAFDVSDSIPSTASVNVSTKLLKEEMKFDGLVVTDALAMKGMTKLFSPGEAAKRAFLAGADILLMSPDTEEAIDSIAVAVARGEISVERIDHSVRKILEAKQWCGLDTNRLVDIDKVSNVVTNSEVRALNEEIARRSITVAGNDNGILPLRNLTGKKVLDIVFLDKEDNDAADDLHDELFKRKRMEFVRIDPRSGQDEFDDVLKKAKFYDLIICQFIYNTRSSEPKSGFLPKKVDELMNAVIALKKPVVTVTLGNPYVAMEFPRTDALVATFGPGASSIDAAAEVIFGEQPATGLLPVTIPGRYAYGEGVQLSAIALRRGTPESAGLKSDSLATVDAIIERAIADSAFPGAVLLAVKDGIIVHEKAYGRFMYDTASQPMTVDAIFDMASVTKVIATTSAMMKLTEEKRLSLDDKIVKYFPAFGQTGKENITLYNLLVHNSGLQAWRKYYEFCDTPQCVLDSIFAAPLIYPTGDSTLYSDLGLITTGKIIERVTGTTLANYVDSIFFKPLGMKSTMYNPAPELLKRIVPTEIDSVWKKTNLPVHGRVHDENAATLGGISGHAGLFSTASDLAKILQMELNYGTYNGRRYLDSATIARFIKQQGKSSRAIGWDTRSTGRSFSGQYTSPLTFLHTGFTGTSVVVEPEKKMIVILLTNRVYPTRNNNKLSRVRPAVHDAVFGAVR
jgi:beta-N-acetylhexosaminidase